MPIRLHRDEVDRENWAEVWTATSDRYPFETVTEREGRRHSARWRTEAAARLHARAVADDARYWARTRAEHDRLRRQVYDDWSHACAYCRTPLRRSVSTLDHLVPRRLGGALERENLALACSACNNRRGDRPFLVWLEGLDPGPTPATRALLLDRYALAIRRHVARRAAA